jgi:hypothetical protein
MVVGLFVYQQLFSFQIKLFRFAYFVLIRETLTTWPYDLTVTALQPWMLLFSHTDLSPSREKIV